MKNFSYNSSINNEPENSQEMYRLWCEKGSWTNKEAFCVFLNLDPNCANQDNIYQSLLNGSKLNSHIASLVSAALIDNSVKNLIKPGLWIPWRAPYQDWLEWALTKNSIDLDDELLLVAGIDITKHHAKEKSSRRPKDEMIMKAKFLAVTKVVLFLSSKARLKDIRKLLENTDSTQYFPGDKTLRKWLKEEGIQLFSTSQTNEEIEKIEKKLSLRLLG